MRFFQVLPPVPGTDASKTFPSPSQLQTPQSEVQARRQGLTFL